MGFQLFSLLSKSSKIGIFYPLFHLCCSRHPCTVLPDFTPPCTGVFFAHFTPCTLFGPFLHLCTFLETPPYQNRDFFTPLYQNRDLFVPKTNFLPPGPCVPNVLFFYTKMGISSPHPQPPHFLMESPLLHAASQINHFCLYGRLQLCSRCGIVII